MKNTRFNALALALSCLLLAACGDDGETTDSIGDAGNNPQPGNQGQVQFGTPSIEVNESAGSATVTITRTGGSEGAVGVRVTSRNGTASADDYTAVSTTVNFAAGDTAAKTVTVPIANDAVDEPDETLYLTLGSATGGVTIGVEREVLVTIVDDDLSAPAAPKAALSSAYKQLRIDWAPIADATSYRLLKDPTGSAGFAQVGPDLPASAKSVGVDVIVHKEDWLNARYAIAACNSAGCTQSNVLSAAGNSAALIGYLKASNTAANSNFGYAVALSADGNTLAVGAPYDGSSTTGIGGNQTNDCDAAAPTNCSPSSGAVYVFTRSGSAWSAPIYIKAANIGAANDYDNFGSALALSADGNTLAVAAPYEDSATVGVGGVANELATSSGAVYVYTRSGTSWSGPTYIKASNPGSNDYFGGSIALSTDGNTLAVGAQYEDGSATGINGAADDAASSAGAVYVYARSGATWTGPVYVKASNTTAGTNFGSGVDLSADGNTLAVGSPYESSAANGIGGPQVYNCSVAPTTNCLTGSGAVYIYSRVAGTWSPTPVYVKASTPSNYSNFGYALALSDDGATVAVGAPTESSAATGIGGNEVNGCGATPLTNCAYQSGAAYVYSRSGATWSAPTYIKASNTGESDWFGSSLALSADGSTLAVGAPYEQGSGGGVSPASDEAAPSAGAIYVLTRSASGWSSPTYVKSPNPGASDYFGAIALSADGSTMVVGTEGEDSAATGFNGNQRDDCNAVAPTNCAFNSGAVYSY